MDGGSVSTMIRDKCVINGKGGADESREKFIVYKPSNRLVMASYILVVGCSSYDPSVNVGSFIYDFLNQYDVKHSNLCHF